MEDHCRSLITGENDVSGWLLANNVASFWNQLWNISIFAKMKLLRVRIHSKAGAKHHDAVHVHTSSCTFVFAGHLQRKRKFKECTPLRGYQKKSPIKT